MPKYLILVRIYNCDGDGTYYIVNTEEELTRYIADIMDGDSNLGEYDIRVFDMKHATEIEFEKKIVLKNPKPSEKPKPVVKPPVKRTTKK